MNLRSTVSLSISMVMVAFVAACSQSDPPPDRPAEKAPAATAPVPGEAPRQGAAAATAPAPGEAPRQGATAERTLAGTTAPPAPGPVSRPAPGEAAPSVPPGAAVPAPTSGSTPAAKPAEPPRPKLREVTIPAGTRVSLTLVTPLASDTSTVEDEVRASLAKPIVVGGVAVVPAGAKVVGSVVEAKRSGRVKGRASLSFRFERLLVGAESYDIETALVSKEAGSSAKNDAKKGAIGAGAGAVVGGIVGGGKGAAIGAGVGGAGAIVGTRGVELQLPAGTAISAQLSNPLTMLVPVTGK